MISVLAGLANAARGKGFLSTWAFNIIIGSFIAGLTIASTTMPLSLHLSMCIAGVALWKMRGWGLYFAAFNGGWNRNQSEVKWIDWIGYKVVPFEAFDHTKSNRKRGLICMAIRGSTGALPLFLYLGFAVHPLGYLLWILMAMQGVFYWLMYWVSNEYEGGIQTAVAEFLTIYFLLELVSGLT